MEIVRRGRGGGLQASIRRLSTSRGVRQEVARKRPAEVHKTEPPIKRALLKSTSGRDLSGTSASSSSRGSAGTRPKSSPEAPTASASVTTSSVAILDPSRYGLPRYAEYHTRMLRIPDERRWSVRDATAKEVYAQLDFPVADKFDFVKAAGCFEAEFRTVGLALLPEEVRTQLKFVNLFRGPATKQDSKKYLLGHSDVVAFPVHADYNASFRAIDAKDHAGPADFRGWFWVLHAAAPNIGESIKARDFICYKKADGHLDEDMYVHDMTMLWRIVVLAMGQLHVEDAVVFPFGMGAFLRNLGLLDKRYSDESRMYALRIRLARGFAQVVAEHCMDRGQKDPGPSRVHLCLVCVGREDIMNHNAFVEAMRNRVKLNPGLEKVVHLRRNVDAFELCHNLSKGRAGSSPKVCLMNGGNRQLIGNHWFDTGAVRAIDENIHRRSASMCRIALLLNGGVVVRDRAPDELAERIRYLGGTVHDLTAKLKKAK